MYFTLKDKEFVTNCEFIWFHCSCRCTACRPSKSSPYTIRSADHIFLLVLLVQCEGSEKSWVNGMFRFLFSADFKYLGSISRYSGLLVEWPNHSEPRREKTGFCICENKTQISFAVIGNREADQRLCFRYTDSTIPLLPKYKISSLYPFSEAAQPDLCRTWSETPKNGFLTSRLVSCPTHFARFLTLRLLSLVLRKPVFGVSDQVRHTPGWAINEDG